MTVKKIEFTKKPSSKETEKFIDQWVAGNPELHNPIKTKRTTIYIPEDMRKLLKVKAAEAETTMTDLIVQTIEKSLKQ